MSVFVLFFLLINLLMDNSGLSYSGISLIQVAVAALMGCADYARTISAVQTTENTAALALILLYGHQG